MYEKLEKCPLCNSPKISNYLICKDFLVSGESFAINQCENCSLRFTNPRPLKDALGVYYQSDNYISHSNKSNSLVNFLYKIIRNYTLKLKLKIINQYSEKGDLLDVGCGTGEFLNTCLKDGWSVSGIEPDSGARNQAKNNSGIEILENLSNVPVEKTYDAITLWHVFEHIPDMHDTIERLKSQLTRKGTLIIAVPNVDSFDARKYMEYWAAYDVPRHLYHFNQQSFRYLFKEHDLQLKKIIPMKFDSYYISLLSEKYMNSRLNFFNALLTGFRSNRIAKKHNNNYSSLIYILKK